MDVKVSEGKIKLIGSHAVPKVRFDAELKAIRERFPSHVIWQRSMASLCREWAAHNLAYALGIRRGKTADTDLNYPQSWYVKLLYRVAGSIALRVIR